MLNVEDSQRFWLWLITPVLKLHFDWGSSLCLALNSILIIVNFSLRLFSLAYKGNWFNR